MSDLSALARACRRPGRRRAALVTLVAARGSSYRRPGARLLAFDDGATAGAVAGGCLEADLRAHAAQVLAGEPSRLVSYRPGAGDLVFGTGTGCDGELELLVEPAGPELLRALGRLGHGSAVLVSRLAGPGPRETRMLGGCALAREGSAATPGDPFERAALAGAGGAGLAETRDGRFFVQLVELPPVLALFGAAPEAEPLAALARRLEWRVLVADHREALVSRRRFPGALRLVAPVAELAEGALRHRPAAAVVMTHHFLHDLELLRRLVPHPFTYLGLLGPARRRDRLLRELGVEPPAWLHGPAGLDLGAESPAEIALAIAAEVQKAFREARGDSLRGRSGSIHRDRAEITAAVLAAGGSSRFGAPKQLVRLGGRSLLRRAAESALASGADRVVVVLGAHADLLDAELDGLPVRVLRNPEWGSGLAGSLALAARSATEAGSRALLVTLADQPGIPAEALRALLSARESGGALAAAAAYPDGPGVPAVLGHELFAQLEGLRGDQGARELLRALGHQVVTLPLGALEDVDRPEDLGSPSPSLIPFRRTLFDGGLGPWTQEESSNRSSGGRSTPGGTGVGGTGAPPDS